jgi:branched-chain amino acid transport system permease protein
MTVSQDVRKPGLGGWVRSVPVSRWIIGAAVAAFLVSIPYTNDAPYVDRIGRVLGIAIAAMGLNLLTGFNGQISVGHGAFFGLGAYTTAILVADHEVHFLATFPVSIALCFVVGLVVGLPALRIKGLYLALTTLAVATLFPQLIARYRDLTEGSSGKSIPPSQRWQTPSWLGDLKPDQSRYLVTLAIAALVFLAVRNLVHSRTGRALIAIRDNETAAEVLGVNLALSKVITFGISAAIAGLGGSLSVMNSSIAAPNQYGIALSIEILVAVVVGGVATIAGPALGAYLLEFIRDPQAMLPDGTPELFGWWPTIENPELSPIIFGAVLIALMMVAPGGLLGLLKRLSGAISPMARSLAGSRASPLESG